MTNVSQEELKALFLGSGVESSMNFWDDDEDKRIAVQGRVEILSAAMQIDATRFPTETSAAPPLDRPNLDRLREQNLHKLKAFLQALDATSNPDMLVMVWHIIHGDLIRSVDMKYDREGQFQLEVTLEDAVTGQTWPRYRSQDIDDAALVRHFGILKMGDRPLLDGFYALRT